MLARAVKNVQSLLTVPLVVNNTSLATRVGEENRMQGFYAALRATGILVRSSLFKLCVHRPNADTLKHCVYFCVAFLLSFVVCRSGSLSLVSWRRWM